MSEHENERVKKITEKLLDDSILLSVRERQVILYRFGLDGGECHTVDETAEHFGINRGRVREIEYRVQRRLDNNHHRVCRSRKLKDFLD